MRKLLIPTLIITALLFAVTAVVAQVQGITINGIDDSEFPLLRLLVTVVDADGRPVIGLTESDFTALAAGRNADVVRVEEIRNADLPVSVVLVVDSSESMYDAPMQDTKDAANILLDNLRPVDEVAVIDFDSGYRVVQPFTNDFGAARDAVASVVAGGVTSLYDAAYAGAELAISQANNPRRFVVLVTDGHEYGGLSTHGASDAIQLANDNGVPFFAIGFGSVYPPYLQNLGTNTGGQTYILPSSGQLSQIFDFISNYLRSQYVVTIQAGVEPNGAPAPVTLRSGSASTTRGYVAPDLYPVPSISGIPADPIAEPTSITVSGTAPRQFSALNVTLDGAPVELDDLTVSGDNLSFTGSLTIDPLAFAPGSYNLSAEAVDAAGGSRSTSASFTVAELPLLIEASGILPGETITNEATRTISVEVLQSQTTIEGVTFSVDGVEVETDAEAPYSADITLSGLQPGPHLVTVVVHNAQGQDAEGTLAFVIPEPPTATPTFTPVPPTNTPVPPTATLELATNTPAPAALTFTIGGIDVGEAVTDAARAIRVTLDDGVQAESVTFALDGAEIDRDIAAPYVTTIDTTALEAGEHILDVIVTGLTGETATEQVTFTIVPSPTATPREAVVVSTPVVSTAAPMSVPLTFTISGLEMGQEVNDPALAISVTPGEGVDAASVTFTLDGAELDVDTAAPFVTTIDTTALDAGAHVLDITLATASGEAAMTQIPFTIVAGPTSTPRESVVISTPVISTVTPAVEATSETATTGTQVPAGETPASPDETAVPASETPASTEVLPFTISGLESGLTIDAPLTVEVVPNEGIETDSVTFAIDGDELAVDSEAPYSAEIDPASLTPGDHTLDISLAETSGTTSATQIPFIVAGGEATAQPQVGAQTFSLTGLTDGEVVSEDSRTIEVVPADGVDVADVTFAVDGEDIATVDAAPYSTTLDAASLSEGEHSLSVTLQDAAGAASTQTINFSIPARQAASNDLLLIGGGVLLLLLVVGAWAVAGRRRRA
ncbi:MAG: VWA domain-containing protein [Anaerolineae bacterium]|nr:VWA domain-containing protein [Anaerolineae bacterium]